MHKQNRETESAHYVSCGPQKKKRDENLFFFWYISAFYPLLIGKEHKKDIWLLHSSTQFWQYGPASPYFNSVKIVVRCAMCCLLHMCHLYCWPLYPRWLHTKASVFHRMCHFKLRWHISLVLEKISLSLFISFAIAGMLELLWQWALWCDGILMFFQCARWQSRDQ